MASYYLSDRRPQFGDDVVPATALVPASSRPISLPSAGIVGGLALTYHGIKRTDSIGWGLLYGVLGRFAPYTMGVIALAQGFGQRKGVTS